MKVVAVVVCGGGGGRMGMGWGRLVTVGEGADVKPGHLFVAYGVGLSLRSARTVLENAIDSYCRTYCCTIHVSTYCWY